MTITAAGRPPVRVTSVAAAVDALRARGLRVTAARRRVLEAVLTAEGPVSAQTVARHVDGDLASVYRNLETFEAVGLVRHVHLGHGPGRYAVRDRGGWTACEGCGRHERLPADELTRLRLLVRDATGLDAGFDHFPLVGRCPECANVP
jgi:Fur family transcriptional regulator, ferric uptake regulator